MARLYAVEFKGGQSASGRQVERHGARWAFWASFGLLNWGGNIRTAKRETFRLLYPLTMYLATLYSDAGRPSSE
jgi:hypothetical protein